MAAPRNDNVSKLILDATAKLLKEKSIAEISLAEIAQTAKVSKGTIYYYYKNKEDILFAVMDIYLETQWQNLISWTNDASKDTSLPRLIKYIIERDTTGNDMRIQFIHDAISGNKIIRKKLLNRYKKFEHEISEKIAERTDAVSSDYLAWLLLMLADGITIHKLIGNTSINTTAFIKETEDFVKKILSEAS
ncbi:MAG: TetR/AcrR family transcriptional regulator [Treponema sp.]|nr:TetR/AcrR family transcriptional regulator [Treponema sp.]